MKNKILKISRDKLFFDQYRYCVEFYLQEVTVVRRGIEELDRILDVRKSIGSSRPFGSWAYQGKPITDQTRSDLISFFAFLESLNNFKLTCSCNKGFFYTNNLNQIDMLILQPGVAQVQTREVILDIPRDCIKLKKSNFKYRTYFRSQKISLEDKQRLKLLLANQKVRLGPSLEYWFESYNQSKYMFDNFFIDHNNRDMLLFLNLACAIKIKRTVDIICDK